MTRLKTRSKTKRRGATRRGLLPALLLAVILTGCSTPPEDPGPNAPAVPTGLRASPADGQVTLEWTANSESDLSGYGVYRATTSGALSKVADVAAGITSYTATGLDNGTEYFFAIDAVNEANQRSTRSAEVSATPRSDNPGPTAPATPTGLGASPGDSQVTLNWNANTEIDLAGYGVYRGTTNGTLSKVADIPTGTTSYTASGLTNDTPYFFAVDAVNSANQRSPRSGEVSATPTATPLPRCTFGTSTFGACTLGP